VIAPLGQTRYCDNKQRLHHTNKSERSHPCESGVGFGRRPIFYCAAQLPTLPASAEQLSWQRALQFPTLPASEMSTADAGSVGNLIAR
jgi:hypothetical protein